jgi:hypothetical protein
VLHVQTEWSRIIALTFFFEKERKVDDNLKEKLGAASGGVLGAAGSVAAVSGTGAVSGLGAAGITSGLAAIGGLVGGGMLAGLCIAVVVPVGGCLAGAALVRAIRD